MADYNSNINKQSSANSNNASDASSNWKFAQCFGEKGDRGDIQDITEADIISAVEFDSTGNFLASGDRGGRVVLFERIEDKKGCEYSFYTEFQSHEPEFDYLKSLEIEEKINEIEWVKRQNRAHFLLSANDKTIKLWKVYEKSLRVVAENNLSDGLLRPSYPMDIASLRLPRTTLHDTIIAATPRKIYANAHAYHINSISVSSDDETYISADDLRINLWNLEISDQSFNIVDVKPPNMEELVEVITCAQFHPQSCNIFAYSSSRGAIKLADMRMKALCDEHAKCFYDCNTPATSFFNEITTSISDTRFSPDGRYLVTRDYLSVKIWDLKMESFPIKTINVHEYLQSRLVDTYENDSIFDKFEVVWSGDSNSILTGSYNNNAIIYPNCMPEQSEIPQTSDDSESPAIVLHADSSVFKPRRPGMPTPIGKGGGGGNGTGGGANSRGSSPARRGLNSLKGENEVIDFSKKILHMSWHPQENSIAVAATNNLFVFSTL